MIYTKKANFPYPVLVDSTDDYISPNFKLDVTLRDNSEYYILESTWKISSGFIESLLRDGRARLILIVKSKDNQFFPLEYKKKQKTSIRRNRLCINSRTTIQMMIQATEDISFKDNWDINPFYDSIKDEIIVRAGNALGFSNTVIFDGTQKKPYELFEKKIDPKLKSDIEIRLGTETILVVYKDANYQFNEMQNGKELNYPYLYLGLQKALMAFLIHNAVNSPEDGVVIDEMDPPENALETKLYTLMKSKGIYDLNLENMDEVICLITDNLLPKYHEAIRGMRNGY